LDRGHRGFYLGLNFYLLISGHQYSALQFIIQFIKIVLLIKSHYPCAIEKFLGGHAVVAVGYDDQIKIKNTNCGLETTGALLIRNSWGTSWEIMVMVGFLMNNFEMISKRLVDFI